MKWLRCSKGWHRKHRLRNGAVAVLPACLDTHGVEIEQSATLNARLQVRPESLGGACGWSCLGRCSCVRRCRLLSISLGY